MRRANLCLFQELYSSDGGAAIQPSGCAVAVRMPALCYTRVFAGEDSTQFNVLAAAGMRTWLCIACWQLP